MTENSEEKFCQCLETADILLHWWHYLVAAECKAVWRESTTRWEMKVQPGSFLHIHPIPFDLEDYVA